MSIKFTKRSIFYFLLTILCLLLVLRYAFRVDIPRMVLTLIVIAMAFLGDKNEILAISMACIPMHNAVDFYISIMACAIILVVKHYDQVRMGFPVILALVMILWEALHCWFFDFSPMTLATSLVPLVFVAVVLSVDLQDTNYAFLVRVMSFMACIMCFVVLANVVIRAEGDFSQAFSNLRRLGVLSEEETLFGGDINPNSLGIINVLCMTGLLQIRTVGQKKKYDLFLIFILLLFGVLTLSRTFLVCLLFMFVLILAGQKKDWKRILRILAGAGAVCLVMILVTNWIFPEVISDFIKRFQVEDITTGRDSIMTQYHDYFVSHPVVMFFGVGMSDYAEKVVNIYHMSTHTPHNSIQEIIAAWGIPGLMMIALLLFALIYESKRYGRRKSILNYVPLLIILLKSMAGQLLTSTYSMLALAFAFMSLCQNFQLQETNESDYELVASKTNL